MILIKQWFQQKNSSEQKIIVIGSLCSSLLLIYAFIYLPISRDNKVLTNRIASYQTDLQTMQSLAQQIKRLNPASTTAKKKALSNSSIMTLVEKTAKQQHLKITQIKPLSQKRLQLILNNTSFNAAIRWLNTLQQKHTIKITKITADSQKELINLKIIISY